MITLLNILVTALLSFLTVSLFPHFRFFGVVPLLTLFFIIQLAYYRKGFEPLLLAALAGVYFDIFSPNPFGFYLMLFLITAGLVRYIFEEGLRDFSFWRYLLISGGAVVAYMALQLAFIGGAGLVLTPKGMLPLVATLAVNLVFAALLYLFGSWYFEWLLIIEDNLKRR